MIDSQKYNSRYRYCELTLCLLKNKKENKFYNFLSLIELCPDGMFPSDWIKNKKSAEIISIDETYEFIIDKIKIDVKSALDYYESDTVHLISENSNYDKIYDFGNYTDTDCGNSGMLVHEDFENSEAVLKDLLPKYRVSARVFYKICLNPKIRNLFNENKFINCFRKLGEIFDIALYDKQEFWGAFILYMPDYILQNIDVKLGKDKKSFLINVSTWKNKNIENLTLLLSNEQKNGTGFFFSVPLKSDYNVIPLSQEPDTLHIWIYHTDVDNKIELLEENRCRFIKKVVLDMNIKEQDITYQLKYKTVKAEGSTYLSDSVGEEYSESQKLISESEEKRYLDALERKKTFMYFDGSNNREKMAKQTVKDLLKTAQKSCVLCDPYFSRTDFEDYILPLTGKNCLIQIITTQNKISKTKKDGNVDKTSGEELQNLLDKLNSIPTTRAKIECYVLNNTADDKTALHDRFFIVDENAYLMGSSLNHFGEKATTLYKAPTAIILQRETEIMIKNSKLLSEWLK